MKFIVKQKTAMCVQSVNGQLSDGIWENSPRMDRYWRFLDVDTDKGIVEVSEQRDESHCVWRCRNGVQYKALAWVENGFYGKSLEEVGTFLATKLRTIVKVFCTDNGLENKAEWNKDNTRICRYLYGYVDGKCVDITIGEAYRAYKELRSLV